MSWRYMGSRGRGCRCGDTSRAVAEGGIPRRWIRDRADGRITGRDRREMRRSARWLSLEDLGRGEPREEVIGGDEVNG